MVAGLFKQADRCCDYLFEYHIPMLLWCYSDVTTMVLLRCHSCHRRDVRDITSEVTSGRFRQELRQQGLPGALPGVDQAAKICSWIDHEETAGSPTGGAIPPSGMIPQGDGAVAPGR